MERARLRGRLRFGTAIRAKSRVDGIRSMLRMILVWRGHVDDFNRRVRTQFFDPGVAPGGKLGREKLPRLRTGIRGRHQPDALIADKGR